MKLTLDISKSVEQNAETYYDSAKKAKKKVDGARKALDVSYVKIEKLRMDSVKLEDQSKKQQEKAQEEKEKKAYAKAQEKWFHKFRWFISSEGFLCVGGRDATTNEIIIKKHLGKDDLVFHTDMAGSPFFLIKADSASAPGKKIDELTIKETADATAIFSRAWKLGVSNAEVFYVNPDQVTKETKAGEFIQKGSFMIFGKRNYVNADLKCGMAMTKEGVMAGPISAIKKNAVGKIINLQQGNEKTSDIAKEIKKQIGGELDEVIKALPSGVKIGKN